MVQGGETTTPSFPSSADDAGCACRATGARSVNGLGFGLVFAGTTLAFRRKRARRRW